MNRVVGAGYVGLSRAACVAKSCTLTVGVNKERVSSLNPCKLPIHENRLKRLWGKGLAAPHGFSQVGIACASIGRANTGNSMPLALTKSAAVSGTAARNSGGLHQLDSGALRKVSPMTDVGDAARGIGSMPLVPRVEKGGGVRVNHPAAIAQARTALGSRIARSSSARECIKGADLAIVMAAWLQIMSLKSVDRLNLMRSPVLVDAMRIYDRRGCARKPKFAGVGLGPEGESA
jgi:UDP-glucose/GDP-mannose dehydrogenase family, NAD binding domain